MDNKREVIEIKNLGIEYKETKKKVISSLNFSLYKEEILAVMGPSGCGKTTLLNYIGDIFLNDEIEARGIIEKKENLNIKYVFQDPLLLPWKNVFENIFLSLEVKGEKRENSREKVKKIIETVDLKGFEDYYPYQLSKGMAQRVNFARALISNPDLLLLDEPFSALDMQVKEKIQKDFLSILKKENIAAIFATHDPREALKMADRIIIFPSFGDDQFRIIDKKEKEGKDFFDKYFNFYESE